MRAATPSQSRTRTKVIDSEEKFTKIYEEKLRNKDAKIQ